MRFVALAVPAAMSALLLVATCALWVRSHIMTDDISWYGKGRMTRFRSSGGGFWFETRPWQLTGPPRTEWHRFPGRAQRPFSASPGAPIHERLGFMASTTGYDLLLGAPWWALALISAPLPLVWMRPRRRIRRWWRLRRGLCTGCGHDLRASPEGCPECGHPAAGQPAR